MKLLRSLLALALGLSLGLAVTAMAGENPWHVLQVLIKGAFGTRYDLGMTLFYMTPLLFTGLAVTVAFRAGLFNIGAEGQLTMAALSAAAVGVLFPNVSAGWAWIFAFSAAAFVGGGWAAIAGWLKARRGSHEVISTIMLNFIAASIASYVTLYVLKNPETQSPETLAVGPGYVLPRIPGLGDSPVSWALVVGLLSAVMLSWVFERTRWGFEMKVVGQNENAARMAGISVGRVQILAMTLSGVLAAGVALGEVLGSAHRFKIGFSPDYGFIGIAVALLARGSPLAVIPSAFLFGALHKGTADLDIETEHVTRDLTLVIQALIIATVSAEGLWDIWARRRKMKMKQGGAQAHG
ncbi:ABC transporter permease [bacterium]|nr:ABC transporter permease [bacterium]